MNIVILDAYTANPGDLSWDALNALGTCTIYDRTPKHQVVERAMNAEIVLTNKAVLDRDVIHALPKLRYVGVLATGYNVVAVKAAREKGIPVCNIPEYSTPNVAQAVFAFLLELTNRAGHHAHSVQEGRWCAAPDFCYWDFPQVELQGLTMGLVGIGRIGQAVARIANAFGLKVQAYSHRHPRQLPDYITFTDLDTLFSQSDIVSLHCPLTEANQGFVNAERLKLMKPSAYLLNTARGGLINERDLAQALNKGRLAGAGLDVLSTEPPSSDNPLLKAKNCLITPHIAWATRAARERLLQAAVNNIKSFLAGHPVNVVN
jgi:glycerate dehydrogenase